MADGVIRVGTSGWQYDDWRGAFYPEDVPRRRWLEHYVTRFSTVEVNATFYRLPRASTVQAWHDRVPREFRFAVKGSSYVTHSKRLRDPEDPVATVTTRLAPLASAHGVWLWQLPPRLHADPDRLDRFLAVLPTSRRHAVEFRHRSWYVEEVRRVMVRHGVAWVWLSDRQMPDATPVTGPLVYLRLHGLADDPDERYRYDYSLDELATWAERLRAAAADGLDGWVYFNNDHAAHAPRNAASLVGLLGGVAYRWP